MASGETIVHDVTLDQGTLSMAAGAKLSFDLAQDVGFAQGISDAGALEKRGTAKLTLTGTNTWSGGTTVSAGTLQGNVASLPGDIAVASGATLIFDQTGTASKAGVIRGAGSLIKTGAGTLVLGGANTLSGQTTVSEGVLEGTAATLSGSFSIAQGATLRFAQTAPGTEGGSIGGAGSVEKTGNGMLTLTGANSWSGGTHVMGGVLRGSAQSIPGDISLELATQVTFDQPTDGTHVGNISGDGELAKFGAGTLTLSGTSSYTGGTTISAGALRGTTSSLQGDITNDGALIFAQDGDGTFNGLVSGSGSLQKTGAGSVRIATDQSYTGGTSIAGGALELAAANLPGVVDVLAGGTLRGSGSVGNVTASGRIAPGAPSSPGFGTLSTGDVTFASGSSLEVRVAPGSGNDRLASSGNVAIQPGAALDLRPSAGDYSAPVAFDVLTAGSVSGNFTQLPRFAFLTLNVANPGDRITATLQANGGSAVDLARTDNQRAVAAALEQLQPGASGDLAVVFDSLTLLTEDEVPAALDSLAGEVISDFEHSRIALARRFRAAIDARIAQPGPASGDGAWITGLGLTGDIEGDDSAGDFDYSMGGAALGLDFRPSTRLSLGAAAGWAHSDLELSDLPGDGNLDSALGALYAGYTAPDYSLSSSVYFAHHDMESERRIRFQAIDRRARGDFDGNDFGAALAGSARMFTRGSFRLEPVGSLAWSRLERSSFTESGAGSISLDVGDETLDSLQGALGLWAHSRVETSEGVFFAPELFATWLHEFGDVEREFRASFEGASVSAPFRIAGAELPRDSLLGGFRWSTQSARGASAELAYTVLWNTQQLEHSLSVSLNLVW